MKIAVVGATGTLGTKVCTELERRGHQVVPLSRANGVDATILETLIPACAGVEVVIDCVNFIFSCRKKSDAAFSLTANNIVKAAQENNVPRIVCISIAGVDNPDVTRGYGYYHGKATQEKVYQDSPIDTTIVRSTQWFELLPELAQRFSLGPLTVLPTIKISPLPVEQVAQLICDVTDGSSEVPASGIITIRGAEEGLGREFAERIIAVRGNVGGKNPKVLLQLPLLGSAIASGGLIPATADRIESTTAEEWARLTTDHQ